MDANGIRHHLLLGPRDWSAVEEATQPAGSIVYDPVREDLTLRPQDFRFRAGPGDRPPQLSDRRGAAVDAYRNVYWIDESETSVWVQSSGSGVASVFWNPGIGEVQAAARSRDQSRGGFGPAPESPAVPASVVRLRGLAVTADHYLVVGTSDPVGFLVFDLHAPAPPRHELWPPSVALLPFDLCARNGGGLFVLDRDHRRLWELDRRLQVVGRGNSGLVERRDFAPTDATDHDVCPPSPMIHDGDALPLDGDPIAIETAPGERVFVLDRGLAAGVSTLLLKTPGVSDDIQVQLEDRTPGAEVYRVVGHDLVLVPGSGLGTMYVADQAGNQAYAFQLELAGTNLSAIPDHTYFPMQRFGGKALIAGPNAQPLYDTGTGWVPLVRQSRPQFAPYGVGYPAVFDAIVPGTVWHRLILEAAIPAETEVRIDSRAADERRDLEVLSWQPEPALSYWRRTGSEQPYRQPEPGYKTWEVLFQRATGRYLQLRLTLVGDERRTPRIRALRAYYPRFSYPEYYLPKAYRDDPVSASFLDRFLANAEGIATVLEDRIAAAQALFDPRTCPSEALDWLLGWFEVTADPTWDEQRRRLFLRNAMRFFALRGTAAGLKCALRLAIDACVDERVFDESGAGGPIRIVERFQTRRVPAVQLGDPTELSEPRAVPLSARWDPTQGGDELTRRWREIVGDPAAELPLTDSGAVWRDFWHNVVGVEPSSEGDSGRWIPFLASRYRRVEEFNAAYGLVGRAQLTDFASMRYPDRLPADGAPLRDWYHFVTVVMPAVRRAHRFTVLLAVPSTNLDLALAEERKAVVRRIVELQKPAHTTFDVKFFWSAFRVGEARLEEDTVVGLGSRDPKLHHALVLGQEHIGEASLAGGLAPVPDRVGRDPLNR